MARGISVHIGVNSVDPDHYSGWTGDLAGCEPDARDMAELATGRGLSVSKLLLTAEATAANVKSALEDAAAQLESGDLFFLTYSGHGSQIRDVSGDETDQRDETWVLYDRQVLDDELFALYAGFKPGVRIFILSDSCHSGSVARQLPDFLQPSALQDRFGSTEPDVIARRVRAMPAAIRKKVYEDNQALYDSIRPAGDDRAEIKATVVLMSGCQDNQTSADGDLNGLFTGMLKTVWAKGKFESHSGLHRLILAEMPPDQSPNLLSFGSDAPGLLAQPPLVA
ncbi:MAG: caspase family protein [Acidimicrobiales bacterium]